MYLKKLELSYNYYPLDTINTKFIRTIKSCL